MDTLDRETLDSLVKAGISNTEIMAALQANGTEEQKKPTLASWWEQQGIKPFSTFAELGAPPVPPPPTGTRKRKEASIFSHCPIPWKSLVEVNRAWNARYEESKSALLPEVCVLECGAGGDCLFYVVSQLYHQWKEPGLTPQQVSIRRELWMREARGWAAGGVTPDNVNQILSGYQQEWFQDRVWRQKIGKAHPFIQWPLHPRTWKPQLWGGDFSFTFPPSHPDLVPPEKQQYKGVTITEHIEPTRESAPFLQITHPLFQPLPDVVYPPEAVNDDQRKEYAIRHFKTVMIRKIIQIPGEKFRGDDRSLELMVQGESPIRAEGLGFIVISDRGQLNCSFYPPENQRIMNHYMLLYNLLNHHWQAAGVASQDPSSGAWSVQSIFPRDAIPEAIAELWVNDCIVRKQDVDELPLNHPMYAAARRKFPTETK